MPFNPLFFIRCLYSSHLQDNKDTVRVLAQYRNATSSKTIVDILKDEQGKYLLNVQEMELVNKFVAAQGHEEFPFFTFEDKYGYKFAVPQVRNESDFNLCPFDRCITQITGCICCNGRIRIRYV